MDNNKKLQLLNQVFSPAAPIENIDLFIGRIEQLQRIRQTLDERGQHAVMYGGRGVGKTSLANIIPDLFEGVGVTKITCNRTDNFHSVWEKAFARTKFLFSDKGLGFKAEERQQVIGIQLPDVENIAPAHIEEVLMDIYNPLVFVFDEYDSISDRKTKTQMADVIKMLSDNIPNITVLILGIAESVDELIGAHASLERCIRQIHLPLMSNAEAAQIIKNSLPILELDMQESISERIVEYAAGYPHFVHLLCKNAAKAAIQGNEKIIGTEHFDWAVNESIEGSNQSLRRSFNEAVRSGRNKNQFEDVIYACTLLNPEEMKTFSAEDVIEKYNEITGKQTPKESITYNLGMLCRPERGAVLKKVGRGKKFKYRFRNPMMRPFAKLKMHDNIEKDSENA